MLDLDTLNPNQREAVEWQQGPLLVLAGPGSGKTKVLTTRVAKLIHDTPNQRFRILGLTFTNKAAAEMRERLSAMVPKGCERALLATFHSFSADILRQHGSHVGVKPDFAILSSDEERKAILLDVIRQIRAAGHALHNSDIALLDLIGRLHSRLAGSEDLPRLITDTTTRGKLALVYPAYEKALLEANKVDFGLLLLLANRLLVTKPAIARQIHTIYPHVCVDEFQDTNYAQYQLLRAIVGEAPRNLFMVADDDQIIYQWNGASVKRLLSVQTDFGADVIQLPTNYRCPEAVVALANKLISHNSDRMAGKEPLRAHKVDQAGNPVTLCSFASQDEELEWVVQDIARRPKSEHGVCVILARSRKILEAAVPILQDYGVDATLVVRKNEFVSDQFRWLHAILRLANARGDKDQLARACRTFSVLEGVEIQPQEVIDLAAQTGNDLLISWFDTVFVCSALEPYTVPFLTRAKTMLALSDRFLDFIANALAWFVPTTVRLIRQNDIEDSLCYDEECLAWNDLQQDAVDRLGHENVSLSSFLQEFDLASKSAPITDETLRCMTVHSAKGMEFKHVYLMGLVEGQMPSYQSMQAGKDTEMQEERRSCFVAITRTQVSLTLSYARAYDGRAKGPSRFLAEMGLLSV